MIDKNESSIKVINLFEYIYHTNSIIPQRHPIFILQLDNFNSNNNSNINN